MVTGRPKGVHLLGGGGQTDCQGEHSTIIHIYTRTHIHSYTHTHVHMCTHTHTHTYIHKLHTYTNFTHMYMQTVARKHALVHVHKVVSMCVIAYVCLQCVCACVWVRCVSEMCVLLHLCDLLCSSLYTLDHIVLQCVVVWCSVL